LINVPAEESFIIEVCAKLRDNEGNKEITFGVIFEGSHITIGGDLWDQNKFFSLQLSMRFYT
jgi:hypothetical protein